MDGVYGVLYDCVGDNEVVTYAFFLSDSCVEGGEVWYRDCESDISVGYS